MQSWDPDHVEGLEATVDALPLTDWHRDVIAVSAIATVAHLETVFSDVLEHFNRAAGNPGIGTIFTAARPVTA